MTIYNVPLNHIQANPWQTRSVPSAPEYIKELAMDIAANGLLQIPIGRLLDEKGKPVGNVQIETHGGACAYLTDTVGAVIQLAFGHNRLAAYRWLFDLRDNSDIQGDWSKMPVDMRALSDEQLAVMAWAENEKRRDVTAIERARAIQQRLDHFKWSNRKCGEELGLDHSTISNLLRLLKLPEQLQKAIQEGKLSERQAQAILPVFEAPDSHGFSGYMYVTPQGIIREALEGESSDRLRRSVESYFNSASCDLSDAEFKLDQLLPEGQAIYCGTCSTCDRRMPSRNRCFDAECFRAKIAYVHRKYLEKASQASGYPLVDENKGGYTTPLPRDKAKIEQILATKCPNLVLEWTSEKDQHCVIEGFPHAKLVCNKRNDSCSCNKGLTLVDIQGAAPVVTVETEEKAWQEDEDDGEVEVPEEADPVVTGVFPMPAPLSAEELEEVARQARRAKAAAFQQLPEIRRRLEAHLYQEAIINRPGVFFVALEHYAWPNEDELKSMETIYRRVAKKAAQVILPNTSESLDELQTHIGRMLTQLGLDPLDGQAAPETAGEAVIKEF